MKKKQDVKIEWEEVKNKSDEQVPKVEEAEQKVSDERIAEIVASVENEAAKEKAQPATKQEVKDELKEELKRKYEKSKLRPANLITLILLAIASALIIAELLVVVWIVVKGFIHSASGFEKIFGKGTDIGAVFAAFGYMIYFLLLLLGLFAACAGIYMAVMSVIDTSKLTFLKDEDYMMNIRIKRITLFNILPLIIIDAVLIFIIPIFNPHSFLQYVLYANIPLAVIHVICLISILVQAIVARIRFKKSTTPEHYKEVVSEKRRLMRLHASRERSDGSGRLY